LPQAAAGPAGGGELVFAAAQDFGALDPRRLGSAMSFSMLRHFYESLVWYDENGKIEPVLAESWERTSPTTVRFKLRNNVRFHNGRPFNADAVKFSLEQVLDPQFPAWMKFALVNVVKEARVVDARTVDIVTERPISLHSLLNRLTVLDMVEPGHARTAEQDRQPVGTGPYKFVEFIPRQHLRMERNSGYWGAAPKIERITVRILPDDGTRVAALLRGEVQIINNIPPEILPRIKGAPDLTTTTGRSLRHIFIHLRADRPPLDNVKVRLAMNYAVSKNAIVNSILKDLAVVAKGQFAPMLRTARADLGPYPYDPSKAKRLLAEAGYNGQLITLGVGRGRFPNDAQVGEAVVNYLQQVGMNVRLQVTDFATYSREVAKGTQSAFDAFLVGWSVVPPDPILGVSSTVYSKGNGPRFFYRNSQVDDLIERAVATSDDAEQEKLLREVQAIVWKDASNIFMYHPIETMAHNKRLKGLVARPDEFYFFKSAWLE
jgi:peptide/nickel transport system substrate-binding protein